MTKNKNIEKQTIECNVDSCKHNNCEDGVCELESIKVSCTCDHDECEDCGETICESFETTGSNITDNEYEVNSENEEKED